MCESRSEAKQYELIEGNINYTKNRRYDIQVYIQILSEKNHDTRVIILQLHHPLLTQ
jgi:hypothetical protein